MEEYKKITKEDIDFPAYCFFFIKRIMCNIEEAGMDDKTALTIYISSENHPYCYDAIELIMRTFKIKGYDVQFPNFRRDKKEGHPDVFQYKWTLKKKII